METPLTEPSWLRAEPAPGGAKAGPKLDLEPPADRRTAWPDGVRERWSARYRPLDSDALLRRRLAGEDVYLPNLVVAVGAGTPELGRRVLEDWLPEARYSLANGFRLVVAVHELDALESAMSAARALPSENGEILQPYLCVEVARVMADWLHRLKAAGEHGEAWLEWHGLDTVRYLVPDAVGSRRALRDRARTALAKLAERAGTDAVVDAARSAHGADAATALRAALAGPAAPTLATRGGRPPAPPRWLDPAALPPLETGAGPLPSGTVRNLVVTLVMIRRADDPGPMEAAVRGTLDVCTPESRAAFGDALFAAWKDAGQPTAGLWALEAPRLVGGGALVADLGPLVLSWHRSSGHRRAMTGTEVLAAIGTDRALAAVDRIARRARGALAVHAADLLRKAADRRGLAPDELADLVIPDGGLDDAGTVVYDFGPRRFTVTFDERLRPFVLDASGRARADLPKPAAADDPESARAARGAFSRLRREVRTVAADQITRLERDMVRRTPRTLERFTDLAVHHPLMRHLMRRLVWLTADGTAFRVAEDGTFADAGDDPFTPPPHTTVSVAHPALLDDLDAWAAILADYAVTQPFPQVGRPVHGLTDAEWRTAYESDRLDRWTGARVPSTTLLGLIHTGWRRPVTDEYGLVTEMHRTCGGVRARVDLDPGMIAGSPKGFPEQTITAIGWDAPPSPDADAVVGASEILMDLYRITKDDA